MEGLVRYGINNRYTVTCPTGVYECTLKGKRLATGRDEYAALAPGDRVSVQVVSEQHHHGVIDGLLERDSIFSRWNNKRNRAQVFAANVDRVLCVTSPTEPPFRERFVDRVLVAAEWHALDVTVVLNKIDLGTPDSVALSIDTIEEIGYEVVTCSAESGAGLDRLRDLILHRRSVLVGQSGVGKSSLLNRLVPTAQLRVAPISRKYGRGTHTTRYAELIDIDGGWVVDVPGIREIELLPELHGRLDRLFPELGEFRTRCAMPGCSHLHEPGCEVLEALESGRLPVSRYESYCVLYASLEERSRASNRP